MEKDSVLLVMEAMKMEHSLKSTKKGKIVQLLVGPNQQVEAGTMLVVLAEPGDDEIL